MDRDIQLMVVVEEGDDPNNIRKVQVSVGVHVVHVHLYNESSFRKKLFLWHMLSMHGLLVCFVQHNTPQHNTKAHDPISCGLGHYCTWQREGLFTVICLSTVVRVLSIAP